MSLHLFRSGCVSCHFIDSRSKQIRIYTREGSVPEIKNILRQHDVDNACDFDIREKQLKVEFLLRYGAQVFRNDDDSTFCTGIEGGSVACLAETDDGGLILLTAKHVLSTTKGHMEEAGVYWSEVGSEGVKPSKVSELYYGVLDIYESDQHYAIDIAALPLKSEVTYCIRDALDPVKPPYCGTDYGLLNRKVWKRGITTNFTRGQIVYVNVWRFGQDFFAVACEPASEHSTNCDRKFAAKGDSGALVWCVVFAKTVFNCLQDDYFKTFLLVTLLNNITNVKLNRIRADLNGKRKIICKKCLGKNLFVKNDLV